MSEVASLDTAAPPEGPAIEAARRLRSVEEIRGRARALLTRARGGDSRWFLVDDAALADAADLVAAVTVERYPDLAIPYHSRWRHFEAGGVDRRLAVDAALADLDPRDALRARIDLTVVSVLLDAGAGPAWSYRDADCGLRFTRSEGLAVASWHAFTDGLFSADPHRRLQVDASGLTALTVDALGIALQAEGSNPLVGLHGRVEVLHRLGRVVGSGAGAFASHARPGALGDRLVDAATSGTISASTILDEVLSAFSPIWPSDNRIGGIAVGDCWPHGDVDGPGLTAGWMPFHKLSQWLTYSLLEPLEWAGITVTELDGLTGLPEYRNGGLFLDTGVLVLRDESLADHRWRVGDELVVEWRALTVALLDDLAPLVRGRLAVDADAMPLARILEGGTWAAGRRLAAERRDGLPPLIIVSDGTVF